VVLFWRNPDAPSKLSIRLLGWPKKEFVEHEGLWLTHRDLTEAHDVEELLEQGGGEEPSIDEADPMLVDLDRGKMEGGA
jgi:CRISPR-associated protein Cas2